MIINKVKYTSYSRVVFLFPGFLNEFNTGSVII